MEESEVCYFDLIFDITTSSLAEPGHISGCRIHWQSTGAHSNWIIRYIRIPENFSCLKAFPWNCMQFKNSAFSSQQSPLDTLGLTLKAFWCLRRFLTQNFWDNSNWKNSFDIRLLSPEVNCVSGNWAHYSSISLDVSQWFIKFLENLF